MPSIFISYRRSDSQADAGRIYDRLAAYFGPREVFKDVDDIPPGVDFRDYLNTTLNQCWVVVVVIGPGWLTATDSSGQRRLDNPADWVRVEVEEALRRDGVLVVPLLVGHAAMPRPDQLPDSLQNLAYRNCGEARPDPDFHRDMSRLIARLAPYLHPASEPSPAAPPLPWPAKPQPWNRDPLSLGLSRQRFLKWLAGVGWGWRASGVLAGWCRNS
ncbi:MAG: toll/interleukin-1 receptor domain-containing protein [Leptolyngbyaceae cyanobacterium SM2_5_2]|nr:toll/interleukin-1 receptor domain-containing protein [Leptolyngbyaceae cyanobacterium SM2_5_2]